MTGDPKKRRLSLGVAYSTAACVLIALFSDTSSAAGSTKASDAIAPATNAARLSMRRVLVAEAGAGEQKGHENTSHAPVERPAKKGETEPALPPASIGKSLSAAEQYCTNAEAAAATAQALLQQKSLTQAREDIEQRMKLLAQKSDEYRQWLQRREDFLKRANDGLVSIYAQMEPQTAAAQMANMSESLATAIVSKLSPKIASAILASMDASRAARLTSALAMMAQTTGDRPHRDKVTP